jgi:glycosyltransferase involved in cell wall biosynthesis
VSAEPLVSVVIPAYNAEKTIRNAIHSVLEQTMSDVEVIVVDDASTDGTARVVEGIDDRRILLLRSPSNRRCSAARNLGLRHAKGSWITFLDADDEFVADRLESLLGAALGEEECFVGDRLAPCVPGNQGRLRPLAPCPSGSQDPTADLDYGSPSEWGTCAFPLMPRSALTRHRVEFAEWGSGGEWIFLVSRLCAVGLRGRVVRRVGYLTRVTGKHDSSTLRAIEEQLSVNDLLAAAADVPEPVKERLRRGRYGIRRRLLVASMREHRWEKFAYYARRSPGDLMWLPASVVRFLCRRVRYLLSRSSWFSRGYSPDGYDSPSS